MKRMLSILLGLGLGPWVGEPGAQPADLSDGVFIAHHPPGLEFSSGMDWCEKYEEQYALGNCEDQHNRIDLDGGQGRASVWYVLAAWAEEKTWCGTEFGFGEYEAGSYTFLDWGPCWPAGGLELPSAGWPGPNAGTALTATAAAWSGDAVAVYWFAGYAYEEDLIPLAVDAVTGFGGTCNCAVPPATYAAVAFGGMGLFRDGTYACPPGAEGGMFMGTQAMGEGGSEPQGVCCTGNDCQVTTPMGCHDLGGEFYAGYPDCDPNPCPGLAQWLVCEVRPDSSSIQAAIDRGCDEIVLADGTYRGDGNRDITFWGRDVIVRSASDDPSACVINCEGSRSLPHRGFVFDTYEGSEAKVRGVTITNGHSAWG